MDDASILLPLRELCLILSRNLSSASVTERVGFSTTGVLHSPSPLSLMLRELVCLRYCVGVELLHQNSHVIVSYGRVLAVEPPWLDQPKARTSCIERGALS